MKALVVADTHGDIRRVSQYLQDHPEIDLILHLGDHAEDGRRLSIETGRPIYEVRGNNDWNDPAPLKLCVNIHGVKVLMVHGNRQKVYYTRQLLVEEADACLADLVLFGHTHAYEDGIYDGVRCINPGSPSIPRGDMARSCVLIEFYNGTFEAQRIFL